MANAIITPTVITREALRLLKNSLVGLNVVNRSYQSDFKKIGNSLMLRKPNRFSVVEGATATSQDVEEAWHPLTVGAQKNVSWEFSSIDLTMSIDEYSQRYIQPAVSALAHNAESMVHSLYYKGYHSSGTPGTTPDSFLALGAAGVVLSDHGAPMDSRCSLLNTDATLAIANQVGGFKSGYGVDSKAKSAQEKALIGTFAGFDNYQSQGVKAHTTGARGGTPLVNGGAQGTTYALAKAAWSQTLNVDGASNSISGWAKAGDVFTIAGVYSVNPASQESTGKLQNFTVLADAASNGSGQLALTISPPIIASGPYKTVTAAPADNAALTFLGSASTAYAQNLCFHKDAITFGTIPLVMPDSASWGTTMTEDGLSIRAYKWLDGENDIEKIRLDFLPFADVVHHDLLVRLWG